MAKKAEELQPLSLVEDAETGDQFVLYTTKSGVELELRFDGEEPWATQRQMADLFGIKQSTISIHIKNIFSDGEVDQESNIDKINIADSAKPVAIYSLDVILAVGYRVSSKEGILFRRWANRILKQYLLKGFVIDAPRLKGQQDRFAELRKIIRDIRSDEANVYAELRRICSLCSDYDPSSRQAQEFYGRMQAKLYWATVSHTGAELLRERVDGTAENCGLQTWYGDHVLQDDVLNAKNTLAAHELEELNRVTDILLSVFEDQLDVGRLTKMADADRLLDEQLAQLGRAVLKHGGSISSEKAKSHAKEQYKVFAARRKEVEKARRNSEIAELKNIGSRRKAKVAAKPKKEASG